MKECITIKTDYSLLKSLIKIDDLISYAITNNYKTLGIIDDNLSSSAEFINICYKNNIKPVIGFDTFLSNQQIIIYAKNYQGLKSLFKLNTFLLNNPLNIIELTKYIKDFIILIPYSSKDIYNNLKVITNDIFIGYLNEEEKVSASIITDKIIPFKIALSLNQKDTIYLNTLDAINEGVTLEEINKKDYSSYYIEENNVSELTNLINIKMEKQTNLIPHYDNNIKDSYKYLQDLAIKGLYKRLLGDIPDEYKKRLLYELKIIKEMNYVDYFLIVYDYVKYAIKNDILVGPGRGSAAGSLVTYSLGITCVDPLKYGLLFERFLNPERITMPDIDIDFDASRRNEVVDYVKERYGIFNVMGIMTYGTLAAKQVLISVSKAHDKEISNLLKIINPKKSLKDNLNDNVKKILNSDLEMKQIYYESLKLEGIKKHISTHAAGVVISNSSLDNVIPILHNGDTYLTGYPMNYLEDLGLLKMDFLAIKDLTIISDILKLIKNKININEVDLNDQKVLNRFTNANTTGIFQFESDGIKTFLKKLKPSSFNDLVVAIALYRPGPVDNIPLFINRKNNKEKINYIHPSLEEILKETYGIIVYQEQIMQILSVVAGYSYGEADVIRKAISKVKKEVIIEEKDKFIKRAINNNYQEEIALEIYNLILKFANYGFNKSHSVAYAMLGYQMMYLKEYYPKEYYLSLLNINIGSNSKTKEYIDEAKFSGLNILKPDINLSSKNYIIDTDIIMSLTSIKNVGSSAAEEIIEERKKGQYQSFYDFVSRVYGKSVNPKTLENLIYGGALDSFNETRKTLIENIESAIIYAELINGLDSSLVAKPTMEKHEEYPANILMAKELELYGFYVSNHPASKYNEIKINTIINYFDKTITTVGLLENIKSIKTKKGDPMAFIEVSDETGKLDYIIFPNRIEYINRIKKGDLLKITGKVEKRMDKYQIIVSIIEVLKN
ncbi:MAG: DNA polymerase III subunit alpha [Bacilli bacterium]